MGFQVTPTSVLFQTPPATAPKYQVLASPGTPVTAATRPPLNGPICLHFIALNSAGSTCACAVAQHNTSASDAITAVKIRLLGPVMLQVSGVLKRFDLNSPAYA